MKRTIFGLVTVGVVLSSALGVFLRPRTASESVPIDPLEVSAGRGDMHALRLLVEKSLAAGETERARYWKYRGALLGEPGFTEEYVQEYKTLSNERKQREMRSIETSSATRKQKDALIKRLSEID